MAAVIRAAVEDAGHEHQADDVAARIVAELREHGWTITPLDQAGQPA
ncbi:hypothetical protein MHW47_10770 [Streptomyces sp. OfavH-34-F]|nr:hypothetical protein [Streptomyces sp. OfavH-34-F]MCG7524916.1 hypothetical protein [Streptomyces sp. OfavH-34-F]